MMSGSEDFSAYSQLAPTCFFLLGGGDEAEGYPYSNHSPKFMINEKALINGVKTEVASDLNFLKNYKENRRNYFPRFLFSKI